MCSEKSTVAVSSVQTSIRITIHTWKVASTLQWDQFQYSTIPWSAIKHFYNSMKLCLTKNRTKWSGKVKSGIKKILESYPWIKHYLCQFKTFFLKWENFLNFQKFPSMWLNIEHLSFLWNVGLPTHCLGDDIDKIFWIYFLKFENF